MAAHGLTVSLLKNSDQEKKKLLTRVLFVKSYKI